MKDKKLREWFGLKYLENSSRVRMPRNALETLDELEKRINMVEMLLGAVVKHLKLKPISYMNGGEMKIGLSPENEK